MAGMYLLADGDCGAELLKQLPEHSKGFAGQVCLHSTSHTRSRVGPAACVTSSVLCFGFWATLPK
jgi:hypothetical protein